MKPAELERIFQSISELSLEGELNLTLMNEFRWILSLYFLFRFKNHSQTSFRIQSTRFGFIWRLCRDFDRNYFLKMEISLFEEVRDIHTEQFIQKKDTWGNCSTRSIESTSNIQKWKAVETENKIERFKNLIAKKWIIVTSIYRKLMILNDSWIKWSQALHQIRLMDFKSNRIWLRMY